MAELNEQLVKMFSMELFRKIYFNQGVTLLTFNAFTTTLIKMGIPFDTSFDPGNIKNAAGVKLTIYIAPTTSIVINVDLAPGGSEFTTNK